MMHLFVLALALLAPQSPIAYSSTSFQAGEVLPLRVIVSEEHIVVARVDPSVIKNPNILPVATGVYICGRVAQDGDRLIYRWQYLIGSNGIAWPLDKTGNYFATLFYLYNDEPQSLLPIHFNQDVPDSLRHRVVPSKALARIAYNACK